MRNRNAPTPGEPGREGGKASAGRRDGSAHTASDNPNATLFRHGGSARLYVRDEMAPFQFAVAITADPGLTDIERPQRPGDLSAVLTHARGLSWPDRQGVMLAAAVVEQGGLALLLFQTLADAMACQRRLRAGLA